jgi:hypothetical protein
MVCFQTKNPNLGKFWRALDWKMLICFIPIWNILGTLGIFYDHLLQFVFIRYIISGFGIMHQEKSGNPARQAIVREKKLARFFHFMLRWTHLQSSTPSC